MLIGSADPCVDKVRQPVENGNLDRSGSGLVGPAIVPRCHEDASATRAPSRRHPLDVRYGFGK